MATSPNTEYIFFQLAVNIITYRHLTSQLVYKNNGGTQEILKEKQTINNIPFHFFCTLEIYFHFKKITIKIQTLCSTI